MGDKDTVVFDMGDSKELEAMAIFMGTLKYYGYNFRTRNVGLYCHVTVCNN